MGVLLALIPVLVGRSSMSRSSLFSFSSPLSKFSEFVSRTSSDWIDGGGGNWGFGAAPRRSSKESKCLLVEALGIVRMGAGELL